MSFYDELSHVVKQLEVYRETILYGDYNINWSDKSYKLKLIMTKLNQ